MTPILFPKLLTFLFDVAVVVVVGHMCEKFKEFWHYCLLCWFFRDDIVKVVIPADLGLAFAFYYCS